MHSKWPIHCPSSCPVPHHPTPQVSLSKNPFYYSHPLHLFPSYPVHGISYSQLVIVPIRGRGCMIDLLPLIVTWHAWVREAVSQPLLPPAPPSQRGGIHNRPTPHRSCLTLQYPSKTCFLYHLATDREGSKLAPSLRALLAGTDKSQRGVKMVPKQQLEVPANQGQSSVVKAKTVLKWYQRVNLPVKNVTNTVVCLKIRQPNFGNK